MIKVLVGFFLGLAIAGACAQIVPAVMCMTAPMGSAMMPTGSGTAMAVYVPSATGTAQPREPEPYRSPWGGAWPSERRADR